MFTNKENIYVYMKREIEIIDRGQLQWNIMIHKSVS